jgi:hypothetical protein
VRSFKPPFATDQAGGENRRQRVRFHDEAQVGSRGDRRADRRRARDRERQRRKRKRDGDGSGRVTIRYSETVTEALYWQSIDAGLSEAEAIVASTDKAKIAEGLANVHEIWAASYLKARDRA